MIFHNNNAHYNTVIIKCYGARTLNVEAPGSAAQMLEVDTPITCCGWTIRMRSAEEIALSRPTNDREPACSLLLDPAASVSLEAWRSGRNRERLDSTNLIPNIQKITLAYNGITCESVPQVQPQADPRDATIRQLEEKVTALNAQIERLTSSMGIHVNTSELEAQNADLDRELQALTEKENRLRSIQEAAHINIDSAKNRIANLEHNIQTINKAVQLENDPFFNGVPFTKVLHRAESAVSNLKTAYGLLVQGKEKLAQMRRSAVMTTGYLDADTNRFSQLPDSLVNGENEPEYDPSRYQNLNEDPST